MTGKEKARTLLKQFKGANYVFGLDCTDQLGELVGSLGKRATIVMDGAGQAWAEPFRAATLASLKTAGVEPAGELVDGPRPNAPREDVRRIADAIEAQQPDVVLAAGGGSLIDATKAGCCLVALGDAHPDIEDYFGVGKVTEMLKEQGRELLPLVASQWAASSGAHLTKYSNVTDLASAQKKLIVDEAIVPARALFDYSVTKTMPRSFTADGGLDGVAHALEVFYGARGEALEKVTPVATLAIELIVKNVKAACARPDDDAAREALGLGTDLGGYSIMIGGTNGGHLTSFSLVDVLSHGRACALMNPYYTVFFAPAVEPQLRIIGGIFQDAGYIANDVDLEALRGRELGVVVAEAMVALSRDIDFPTRLSDVEGFTDAHIDRALEAAKNPQLEMKLKNMPVALSADTVDRYMRPILQAAKTGDFSLIVNA